MTFTTVDYINVIGNQTIFSPKDMMINNEKVIIRKLGNALYLVPLNNPWKYLMDTRFLHHRFYGKPEST